MPSIFNEVISLLNLSFNLTPLISLLSIIKLSTNLFSKISTFCFEESSSTKDLSARKFDLDTIVNFLTILVKKRASLIALFPPP